MPLFTTCAEGSGEAVDFLCQKMTRNWIGFPDDVGDTALHSAALNGHAECVAYICNAAWEWYVSWAT
jgi:ankyrin repeat protein